MAHAATSLPSPRAGKTTLLSALACRLDRFQETHGQLKLNGKDCST
jgi:hypothetical protein